MKRGAGHALSSKLSWNSPVILCFVLIAFIATGLNYVTSGLSNALLFSCYRFSPINPLGYVRLVTHVVGHADFSHFSGNMLLLCITGPIIEEKYGSANTVGMIITTAIVTGLITVIFMPDLSICGASGVVFMFILLCSMTNLKNGKIPVTMILVAVMYLLKEVYSLLFVMDNIANFAHLAGGCLGIIFGFRLGRRRNA